MTRSMAPSIRSRLFERSSGAVSSTTSRRPPLPPGLRTNTSPSRRSRRRRATSPVHRSRLPRALPGGVTVHRRRLVLPETFDHTSMLRFLETRFGVEVPNLSAWRRSVTGDLTKALPLASPDTSVPTLPATSLGEPRSPARPSSTPWPAPRTWACPTRRPRPTPCPPRRRPPPADGHARDGARLTQTGRRK